MHKLVLHNNPKVSFKLLQYNQLELEASLGRQAAQQCVNILKQHNNDPTIKAIESSGFKVRVVPTPNSIYKNYNLIDYFDIFPSKTGILFDIISKNGISIIPKDKIATFQINSIQDKWYKIMNKIIRHVEELSLKSDSVIPIERGLTSTTHFKDLGHLADREFPKHTNHEFKQAQLDKLGNLIIAKRRDKYWEIKINKGDNIPIHIAKQINRYYYDTIRIDGMPQGISNEIIKNSYHNKFGVRTWHVDTIEGLSELSAALREYYKIDTPSIKPEEIEDYLATLVNMQRSLNHNKSLH